MKALRMPSSVECGNRPSKTSSWPSSVSSGGGRSAHAAAKAAVWTRGGTTGTGSGDAWSSESESKVLQALRSLRSVLLSSSSNSAGFSPLSLDRPTRTRSPPKKEYSLGSGPSSSESTAMGSIASAPPARTPTARLSSSVSDLALPVEDPKAREPVARPCCGTSRLNASGLPNTNSSSSDPWVTWHTNVQPKRLHPTDERGRTMGQRDALLRCSGPHYK
mmetsp:Transcript_37908/g.80562  ORF Transcript_37908/g.80562 Transcript_37908/m.80562 type:complete len:219 (-) Transcript_37908:16-672(-)